MSLLVTGTIGIDSVQTPHGQATDVLGGSAMYFSLAASLFAPVRLVGVVGEDFPQSFRTRFDGRPHAIDLSGLETRAGAKTFRWQGKYVGDMNSAETLRTDLNVIAERPPEIPPAFVDSEFVFLANTHPALQREMLARLKSPKLVVCDTMNLWINTARDELVRTLSMVHGVVLNDGEARLLTGQVNLLEVGQAVLDMGPRFVVIKKGEHGSMLIERDDLFLLPAFPTQDVRDPTGAGDSFAGGMMGYLAARGRTDSATLRNAIARGTATASFTIEGFSADELLKTTPAAIEMRLNRLRDLIRFT